jgi:predicted lipoprotein with Yx(FWY)xxD motif
MKLTLAIAVGVVALALGACGDDDEAAPAGGQPSTRQAASAGKPEGRDRPKPDSKRSAAKADGTKIVAADSDYGSILFDSDDQAIYLFDKETTGESQCYDACAEAWPPVLTDSEPQAGSGIDAKLVGTTERDDGSSQVTYNDHPLYYYVDDPPGQVLCQNVTEFGGLWLVVAPNGDAVS